jgi:hypothetical protein
MIIAIVIIAYLLVRLAFRPYSMRNLSVPKRIALHVGWAPVVIVIMIALAFGDWRVL